jgi:MFS transporter, ACS family, solute carrier family 17 (sodium-dependent inorganic phosphate cotransporter), other
VTDLIICICFSTKFLTIVLPQVYNVNLKQAAWFSAIPWAVMAMSGYVAGASADFLIKSGFSIALVRKIMQVE